GALSMTVPVDVSLGHGRLQGRIERVPDPWVGVGMPVVMTMNMNMNMVRLVGTVAVRVFVGSVLAAPKLPPGAPGDPEPEADQGKAGAEIDDRSIAGSDRGANNPDDDTQQQRRDDMTGARRCCRPRRLCARPAALPREHGNR